MQVVKTNSLMHVPPVHRSTMGRWLAVPAWIQQAGICRSWRDHLLRGRDPSGTFVFDLANTATGAVIGGFVVSGERSRASA